MAASSLRHHRRDVEVLEKRAIKKPTAKKRSVGRTFIIPFCFIIAFWVVNRYVAMYESSNEVAKLKTEYGKMVTENQQLRLKIDKSIDLKNLENTAVSRLGMTRPEKYQIHYVDMRFSDYAEPIEEGQRASLGMASSPGMFAGPITNLIKFFW